MLVFSAAMTVLLLTAMGMRSTQVRAILLAVLGNAAGQLGSQLLLDSPIHYLVVAGIRGIENSPEQLLEIATGLFIGCILAAVAPRLRPKKR